VWFERGVKVSGETLKRISEVVVAEMLERLKNLGRRRPAKDTLRERVRQALEETSALSEEWEAEIYLEGDEGNQEREESGG